MNFQLAKIGHSFKGSMAYYLHDKRPEEGGPHPTTAERVAWTETRNLAGAGPQTATRMMIATASRADELKAAAGVATTGRKATAGPVFAFSLQWRADEMDGVADPRAEMTRAADQALQLLGLADRQAILVAHSDRAHPHVHVILSRVSPEDGRMAKIDPNKVRALDKWANDYERERGRIVSPNRAAKHERIEDKRRRHTDPEKRRAYVLERDRRRKAEREERLAAAKRQEAQLQAKARPAEPHPAAILKALSDEQTRRHKEAWRELSTTNTAARQAIYAEAAARIAEAVRIRKELARPAWAQHFRQERDERRTFEQRERAAFGIIGNALAAAKQQMASGQVPNRGLLSLTFANVLNGQARAAALMARQETRRGDLACQLRAALDADVAAIKTDRAAALARQRQAFDQTRADLIDTQNRERAKIREAWKHVPGRSRAWADAGRVMQEQTMRDNFDKARRLAQANPSPHPTERRHVSMPAPAPAPAGTPPLPARTVQDVPHKPDPILRDSDSKPLPAKDWTRAAAPASAPLPPKDWSTKPELVREIKPLPPRSQDRERER